MSELISKVYFHRNHLIGGKRGEWWIYNDPFPDRTFKTVVDAKMGSITLLVDGLQAGDQRD